MYSFYLPPGFQVLGHIFKLLPTTVKLGTCFFLKMKAGISPNRQPLGVGPSENHQIS